MAREREMVEETQRKLQGREQELRDREETFRKRLDQKIEERLRDARREIDHVVDELKTRAAAIPQGRLVSTGDIGAARADARSALEGVESKLRQDTGAPPTPPSSLSGMMAFLFVRGAARREQGQWYLRRSRKPEAGSRRPEAVALSTQ